MTTETTTNGAQTQAGNLSIATRAQYDTCRVCNAPPGVPCVPAYHDIPGAFERAQCIAALWAWIKQRPGLEPGNYISHGADHAGRQAYASEIRSITKDLHQARTLLRAVEIAPSSITMDRLREAFSRAFSGRLTWTYSELDKGGRLEYCTGQYWPTEYRRAVCAVLASALWDARRECMPAPTVVDGDERYQGKTAGDWIRSSFRREFGRGLASRWFS